jgi:hypothetical protein
MIRALVCLFAPEKYGGNCFLYSVLTYQGATSGIEPMPAIPKKQGFRVRKGL